MAIDVDRQERTDSKTTVVSTRSTVAVTLAALLVLVSCKANQKAVDSPKTSPMTQAGSSTAPDDSGGQFCVDLTSLGLPKAISNTVNEMTRDASPLDAKTINDFEVQVRQPLHAAEQGVPQSHIRDLAQALDTAIVKLGVDGKPTQLTHEQELQDRMDVSHAAVALIDACVPLMKYSSAR